MIFWIMNEGQYIERITLDESNYSASFNSSVSGLIKAYSTHAFIDKTIKGSLSHLFVLTEEELYYMQKLYNYQEAGYTIVIREGEFGYWLKLYFTGNFYNKRIGMNDNVAYFEFPASIEITGIYDSPQVASGETLHQYGSDKFMEECDDGNFAATYPKYTISDYGELYVENAEVINKPSSSAYGNIFKKRIYGEYDIDLIIKNIKLPYNIGSRTNGSFMTWHYSNPYTRYFRTYIYTVKHPSNDTQRMIVFSDNQTGTSDTYTGSYHDTKNLVIDFKLSRIGLVRETRIRLSGDSEWSPVLTTLSDAECTENLYFYIGALGTISPIFKHGEIIINPDVPVEVSN